MGITYYTGRLSLNSTHVFWFAIFFLSEFCRPNLQFALKFWVCYDGYIKRKFLEGWLLNIRLEDDLDNCVLTPSIVQNWWFPVLLLIYKFLIRPNCEHSLLSINHERLFRCHKTRSKWLLIYTYTTDRQAGGIHFADYIMTLLYCYWRLFFPLTVFLNFLSLNGWWLYHTFALLH